MFGHMGLELLLDGLVELFVLGDKFFGVRQVLTLETKDHLVRQLLGLQAQDVEVLALLGLAGSGPSQQLQPQQKMHGHINNKFIYYQILYTNSYILNY